MTFYILLTFAAFMLSLIGTRLTILALRRRVVPIDISSLKNAQAKPAPRGGGIAVVMALVICLLVADIDYAIVLAVFLLAALSLLDDLIGVHVLVRLLVQVLSVLIPLGMIHTPVFGGLLPLWLDKTATAIVWIWFINLFSAMDGVDGMTPVEMICIGMGLYVLTVILDTFPSPLATYSLIVVAAAWGFLWWNWYPAKILLGAAGSAPLGFIVGYLLLMAVVSGYGYAAAILPAYYLSDATITLISRIVQRKSIWARHSQHYYQKALRHGRRPDTVVRYVFGVNLLLILLAAFTVIDPSLAVFHLALAYMAVFMILGFFAHSAPNPHYEPF